MSLRENKIKRPWDNQTWDPGHGWLEKMGLCYSIKPKNWKRNLKKRQLVKTPAQKLFVQLLEELQSLLTICLWLLANNVSSGNLMINSCTNNGFRRQFHMFCTKWDPGEHWAKDSVTIYPVIARYKCANDECNDSTIDEIIGIISNDLVHDTHAIHKFTEKVLEFLREDRILDRESLHSFRRLCCTVQVQIALMGASMTERDFDVGSEKARTDAMEKGE